MYKSRSFLSVLLIILLAVYFLKSQIYRIYGTSEISTKYQNELLRLATIAKNSNDLPRSAIIIYKRNITGKGYNTIISSSNAAGHAVINAISNAVQNLGIERFNNLNRDSLFLIATMEPCPMCKTAIENYKIENIKFFEERPFFERLENLYEGFLYEFNKKKLDSRQHPFLQSDTEDKDAVRFK